MNFSNLFTIFAIFLALLSTIALGVILKPGNVENEVSKQAAFDKIINTEVKIKEMLDSTIKWALPSVLRMASEANVSGDCLGSMMTFVRDLRELKLWATQMLDASGKPASGFLQGSMGSMGDYDECLKILGPETSDPNRRIKGQYCLVDVRSPLPPRPEHIKIFEPIFMGVNGTLKTEAVDYVLNQMAFIQYDSPPRTAVCLPSKCTIEDLDEISNLIVKPYNFKARVHSCEVKEPKTIDNVQIVILCVIAGLVLICLTATIVEITCFNPPSKDLSQRLVKALSVRSNFEKGFDMKNCKSMSLDFLYGMRYISMWWVIIAHAYLLIDKHLFKKLNNIDNFRKNYLFLLQENAYLAVDSFLFIAAVLLSYTSILANNKKKNSFNPIKSFVCRIWRLLPSLLLVIGLALILPLSSSGPMWKTYSDKIANQCRNYWWTNLLFINNFLAFEDQCYIVTWYLAVDVQCYIIGLIYVFCYIKKPILGKIISAALLVGSILSSGIVNYWYSYPPTTIYAALVMTDFKYGSQHYTRMYITPHIHFSVYAVGLFTGTIMATRKVKLNKISLAAGWILSTGLVLVIFLVTYSWHNGASYSAAESFAYFSLYRTGWALFLSWISISCFSGNGGIVNYLLSFQVYKPLGQLTYLSYLLHYLVIYYYVGSLTSPVTLNHMVVLYFSVSVSGISHAWAFLAHLFVEAPMSEFGRIVYGAMEGVCTKRSKKTSPVELPNDSKLSGISITSGETENLEKPIEEKKTKM